MPVVTSPRTRPGTASEPLTVCLTFGPAADIAHLLRSRPRRSSTRPPATAIDPSTNAEGAWLRVTCEVDPAHVATLVALPSLGDHRADNGPAAQDERCPACELRAYLREH